MKEENNNLIRFKHTDGIEEQFEYDENGNEIVTTRKNWINFYKDDKSISSYTHYSQGEFPPDWWESDPDVLYFSATSGSHWANEWYAFPNREAALEMFHTFKSQSFIDSFTFFRGEIYHSEDVLSDYNLPILKKGAKPAEIGDVIWAESRF